MNSEDTAQTPIAHTARVYQTYPGSSYSLPTDNVELQRLILQHNSLKILFQDCLVFPPLELGVSDQVLDVGTGPGLWILELARSAGSQTPMVAIDIEARLFPQSPPPNIEFRVASVLNLPEEWTDTFSLVNQRLLMLALRTVEWPQALHELYRVTRRGGWVQLGEGVAYFEGEYPDKPCMEKLVACSRRLAEARDLFIDCANAIPTMLEEAGFVDIHSEMREQPVGKWAGEIGEILRDNQLGVFKGLKTPVLLSGGFGIVSSEAEYDALLAGVVQEWDEIPGTKTPFLVHCARKPMD
ncbi:S-adenosyl-L-methionine-dependent methyltransferase [Mycena chlorophos]|uniref:S-adenosyl-L-methionine-dependent methyltransferase n=1 Tax=Mycena chlorophos TaxID=658473 RepID=A0A8H6RXX1_MYCCL|nr:S-adenosyl-L-methionine-dependent methyltransferase [Mycena chlorophos]